MKIHLFGLVSGLLIISGIFLPLGTSITTYEEIRSPIINSIIFFLFNMEQILASEKVATYIILFIVFIFIIISIPISIFIGKIGGVISLLGILLYIILVLYHIDFSFFKLFQLFSIGFYYFLFSSIFAFLSNYYVFNITTGKKMPTLITGAETSPKCYICGGETIYIPHLKKYYCRKCREYT